MILAGEGGRGGLVVESGMPILDGNAQYLEESQNDNACRMRELT